MYINKYPELNKNVTSILSVWNLIPQGFVVGSQANKPEENESTLVILGFSLMHKLPLEKILPMFAEAYEEVLADPDGDSHLNIRALISFGIEAFFPDKEKILNLKHVFTLIESAWDLRSQLSPSTASAVLIDAVNTVIDGIDKGVLRTAVKLGEDWYPIEVVKKAIVLSFPIKDNVVIELGELLAYDKVPLKFSCYSVEGFADAGARLVPGAIVRQGSYIAPRVVLMPSFVNIGAYVDEGTMVDTWATIGSCAQIGKNCHISGGVGIGGVLEPLQARPTIIEDNCFIGARSEIVEGVIVEKGSVISMGVFIGQSTKVFNRMTGEITYGRIPAGSVVVPGNLPSKDGSHSLYCAVIIKHVDKKTRSKIGLNELLRD